MASIIGSTGTAMIRMASLLGLIAWVGASSELLAQAYPSKPLKLIVPLGVGSPPDVTGRMLAQKMSENIGQPIVVENRSGAGGTVGGAAVAKSPPDGYTLLMGSGSSLVLGPAFYPNAGYSATQSFAPVSLVSQQPFILAVTSSLMVDNLREFITLIKANPGKFNYGSPQTASPPFMAAELLSRTAGLQMVHVPFGSLAKVVMAMVSGDAQFYIEVAPVFMSQIRAGTVKAIATASAKRSPFLPDVPTTAEAGLPNFETGTWGGVVAPAGTPATVISRLNQEVHKAMSAKDIQEGFTKQMFEIQTGTPEDLARHIVAENAKWTKLIADSGIKPN